MYSRQYLENNLIADIRARTNFVAIVQQTTTLRRSGDRYVGFCPFHDEKTPSFHVVPGRRFYHCFGCGAHGDAFDFIMHAEGVDFPEAVRRLAKASGVSFAGQGQAVQPRPSKNTDPQEQISRRAREWARVCGIWKDRKPLAGSVAETYLVEARGLCGAWLRECPVLGFAPRLAYWATAGNKPELIWESPALLAAMQNASGKFAAVHITYLQPDGSGKLALHERPGVLRPAKKVRGSPRGAAIRLTPAAERMVVGEGIETTASVFGVVPHGWAAFSLDNMCGGGVGIGPRHPDDRRRRLPSEFPEMSRPGMLPPPECRHVTYLGDGDTKDQLMLRQKLKRAVRRVLQRGLKADYAITPEGTDFNDLVRRKTS